MHSKCCTPGKGRNLHVTTKEANLFACLWQGKKWMTTTHGKFGPDYLIQRLAMESFFESKCSLRIQGFTSVPGLSQAVHWGPLWPLHPPLRCQSQNWKAANPWMPCSHQGHLHLGQIVKTITILTVTMMMHARQTQVNLHCSKLKHQSTTVCYSLKGRGECS